MSRRWTVRMTSILALAGLASACAEDGNVSDDELELRRPVEGHCATMVARDPFAQCVEDFSPAPDASFGHPMLPGVVLGPPAGTASADGSVDVASLGCGGRITLYFGDDGIADQPGPDFIVFENPLDLGAESFAEPAEVWVSEDGEHWEDFPCRLDDGWPPTGCAGIEPVFANADNGWATDPARSGGDAFDLDDVGLARARYVRLVDRNVEYFGDRTWCGAAGGFDLDAIARVEAAR